MLRPASCAATPCRHTGLAARALAPDAGPCKLLLPSALFGHAADERVRVTFGHEAMLGRLALWEADLARHGLRT